MQRLRLGSDFGEKFLDWEISKFKLINIREVMRYLVFTLSIVLAVSCSKSYESKRVSEEHIADTIYASSFSDTPTYERMIVKMSDTSGLNNLSFQIGRAEFLKVSIPRFEEYSIFIDSTVNVKIGQTDSINGIFELTPIDTFFSFHLFQNYGNGNVVLKHSRTDSGFSVKPLNGYQFAGYREITIKN